MIGEIIASARVLLENEGSAAISVRGIARQIGVSPPAIYRYFPSLDALIGAVRESVTGELCAAIEPARDQPEHMARAFRGWALDNPASFRFMLGLDGHGTLAAPLPAPPPAALLPWAALCGLALLELACDREDLPDNLDRLYETAARLAG